MNYTLILQFYFVINIKNQEFINAFGINLRKLRTEAKMSQEDLANDSNIPLSQIGRIERGEINTSISTVFALANALDKKVSELFLF
jgi:transcriptional regulator with XRE-family HTH domain